MTQYERKKVLLVSWHFPPYKSSSAFNLFKRLKDTGYDYDVLQIKRAHKPDNEGMYHYAASRFKRYEIEVPNEDARDPEARAIYVENVLALYERLKEDNHYRIMVSHSHEMVSHIAAMAIKKVNPSMRWVASFGDPIAANPYNQFYKFPMLAEDSKAETQILQQADRIIVTNPYQTALVTQTQTQPVDSDKFFLLPHCFDERMYPRQTQQATREFTKSHPFRFMHVGMLYKFKRTSEPFMRGAQYLLQKHPELKGRFTLEFYGANDRFIQAASDYGLEGIVSFGGTVSYKDSLAVMTQADCLLLRDADFTDQGLRASPFYPGKLADYLGAKKPIIAVTMAHGCVPDMLATLGGASLTEEHIEGIAGAMYDAIQGRLTINPKKADRYSHRETAPRARTAFSFSNDKKRILIAGHDLKFAKFIMEAIEHRNDMELFVDQWNGHNKHDEAKSLRFLHQADTIFCEWGLGNLVWYSEHKKAGQKLVTRVHAQEIRTRHLEQCHHDNIDTYIFVSPYYFELMIAEFSLDRKKCRMIFNMVDSASLNKPKLTGADFHLGMLGDVPQSKRLDRALDVFEKLYSKDKRYKLFIKGKRPEEFRWMRSPQKTDEMAYYQRQYQRIKDNSWADNVIFEGFGPIDQWFQKIGWILSVSDHESFHLAVAEGMASGAKPAILHWPGCEYIYPAQTIRNSVDSLCAKIENNEGLEEQHTETLQRFCKHANLKQLLSLL